jgi:hypothetical protein
MNEQVLDIEPEIEIGIEPEPEPESPETQVRPREASAEAGANPVGGPSSAVVAFPVSQVLPADFELPRLIRFVPNPALRAAVSEAATYALSIEVSGPEGLQRADVAMTALRTAMKGWEDPFAEPKALANQLHKHITGALAEGLEPGAAALKTLGSRIYTEKQRLDAIEREQRQKAQDEANRQARELARREAEAAEKAKAPAPVVEELKRQAQTVTAPPVQASTPAPKLAGSSVVTTWKARIAGTPPCDDPNPGIEMLSPAQKVEVMKLLKAILDGRAPMAAIDLNWSYLSKRAKADKSTLQIPGIEAFEEGSVRAKGTRAK